MYCLRSFHFTQDGRSALISAASEGRTKVVVELVKARANLDLQDDVCLDSWWYTLRFVIWLACSSFQTTRVSSCPLCYRPIASNFYWPGQWRSLAPPTITTPLAIGWALAWQLITVHFGFSAACALHTSVHANVHVRPASMRVHFIYTLKSGPAKTRPARPLAMAMCYDCTCTYHLCVHVLPHLSSHSMVGLHWYGQPVRVTLELLWSWWRQEPIWTYKIKYVTVRAVHVHM